MDDYFLSLGQRGSKYLAQAGMVRGEIERQKERAKDGLKIISFQLQN